MRTPRCGLRVLLMRSPWPHSASTCLERERSEFGEGLLEAVKVKAGNGSSGGGNTEDVTGEGDCRRRGLSGVI